MDGENDAPSVKDIVRFHSNKNRINDKLPEIGRSRMKKEQVIPLQNKQQSPSMGDDEVEENDDVLDMEPIGSNKTHKKTEVFPLFITLPDSRLKFLWDVGITFLIFNLCFALPYQLAFYGDSDWNDPLVYTTDFIFNVVFALDIIINFRTIIFEDKTGKMVTSGWKIALNYCKGWFWVDLISSIPYDSIINAVLLSGHSSTSASTTALQLPRLLKTLRLARLTKLLRLLKISKLLDFIEDHLDINRQFFTFMNLIFILLFVAHLVACVFFASASWSETYEYGSWVHKYEYLDKSIQLKYRISIYWALTVMTTIGFGDVVAITETERSWAVLSMLLGAGTYGFIIASMTNLLSELSIQKEVYNRKVLELNQYMESRRLPRDLRVRARQYYKYFLSRKIMHSEASVMDEFSAQLRNEVYLHIVQKTLNDVEFLKNRDAKIIASLMSKLKPVFYPPEEFIITEGQIGNEMFLITEGSVSVFSYKTNGNDLTDGVPIARLSKGDIVGEMSIVLDHKINLRSATVISLTYCDMYCIQKEDLLEEMVTFDSLLHDILKIAWERERNLQTKIQEYNKLLQSRKLEEEKKWNAVRAKLKKQNIFQVASEGLKVKKSIQENIKKSEVKIKSIIVKDDSNLTDDVATTEERIMGKIKLLENSLSAF